MKELNIQFDELTEIIHTMAVLGHIDYLIMNNSKNNRLIIQLSAKKLNKSHSAYKPFKTINKTIIVNVNRKISIYGD